MVKVLGDGKEKVRWYRQGEMVRTRRDGKDKGRWNRKGEMVKERDTVTRRGDGKWQGDRKKKGIWYTEGPFSGGDVGYFSPFPPDFDVNLSRSANPGYQQTCHGTRMA